MEVGLRNSARDGVAQLDRPVAQENDHSELNLGAWISALRELPVSSVTEKEILSWVEGPLRLFFPFEKFLGFYGKLVRDRVEILSITTSGYPAELRSKLGRAFRLNERACIAWWLSNREPFILNQSIASSEAGHRLIATSHELDEVNQFSLGAVAAHGVFDRFVDAGTFISFSGIPLTRPQPVFTALRLIAPVLHGLLLQTKKEEELPVDLTVLTDRQKELVDLALEGLSDKAIGRRLAISEHTVGNHFRTIYAKLGISKRNQLTNTMFK